MSDSDAGSAAESARVGWAWAKSHLQQFNGKSIQKNTPQISIAQGLVPTQHWPTPTLVGSFKHMARNTVDDSRIDTERGCVGLYGAVCDEGRGNWTYQCPAVIFP